MKQGFHNLFFMLFVFSIPAYFFELKTGMDAVALKQGAMASLVFAGTFIVGYFYILRECWGNARININTKRFALHLGKDA